MPDKVTRNDIPNIGVVKEALLAVLASGRQRAFDNISGDVSKELKLTRGQRAYKIAGSERTLFENRLVQARAELTREGAITYRSGKVKLAKGGTGTPKSAQPTEEQKPPTSTGASALSHPEGRPTKCLSFREPWATLIATGQKTTEYRSRKINTPIRDLVVCASKTVARSDYKPGLVYGKAIGLVDVVACAPHGNEYAWKLESPRLVRPFDVHATASFFYVADEPEEINCDEESYREHVLPHAFGGDPEEVDRALAAMFGDRRALAELFGDVEPWL